MTGTDAVATLLAVAFAATYAVPMTVRLRHAFELHGSDVVLDAAAQLLVAETADDGGIRIVVCDPHGSDAERCRCAEQSVLLLEIVEVDDWPVGSTLTVTGGVRDGHRVLWVSAGDIADAIAAVALQLRDRTGRLPQVFLPWTDESPLKHFARFVLFGVGEVTLRTRAILRRAEPEATRRPTVHVG